MPILGIFPSNAGDSVGGLTLGAVSNIRTLAAGGKVYVKWTDPEDFVADGSTLAAWGGTLLVRKAGSAPASRRDGTVVLDSKTRNAYRDTYFCDSGLTDGVTYYYKFYPYTIQGAYTNDLADEFSETPEAVPLGDVSNMDVVSGGDGKLAIKWTDPEPRVEQDGVAVATWSKTVVVIKEGDYAIDPEDVDAAYKLAVTTHDQYASTPLIATGLTNGTTYYVSLFPVSTDGAVNANAVNRASGVPNRFMIDTVPSQTGTLTYNGASQSPSWNGYDPNKMTISNQTAGTNAGTYVAQFTPKDDYCWAGGSVTAKNVSWVIGKKTGALSLNASSVTLNKTTRSKTVAISGEFDGVYSVKSSDTSVATASVSGKTITIKSVNDKTGTATITVSCSGGSNYTVPGNKTISVTANFATIYGVEWDGTSTTKLTRTDASADFTDPVPAVNNGTGSSPFDTLQPWAGMVRVTDAEAGELVAIPKFWYKFTKSGNTLKLQIADGAIEGFFVSPAHADRGDGKGERDVVYVGRYHCGRSDYKSQTGKTPGAGTYFSPSTSNSRIHKLGATIWIFDYAMMQTIQMLYLVEFANWDVQAVIGYGCSSGGKMETMGYTDTMQYHTGTTQSARNIYGGTQYRNIEGLWDNVLDWVFGAYYENSILKVLLNPAEYNGNSNGVSVGPCPGAKGFISAFDVAEKDGVQWLYPSATSGREGAYVTDYFSAPGNCYCLSFGSMYSQYQSRGLFHIDGGSTERSEINYVGCRLQKLP